MNWSKVTFEVFYFYPGLVIKLVQLQILPSTDKDLLVHVERGGVRGGGDAHLFQLLKSTILMTSNYFINLYQTCWHQGRWPCYQRQEWGSPRPWSSPCPRSGPWWRSSWSPRRWRCPTRGLSCRRCSSPTACCRGCTSPAWSRPCGPRTWWWARWAAPGQISWHSNN